jgi:hypothetical protein
MSSMIQSLEAFTMTEGEIVTKIMRRGLDEKIQDSNHVVLTQSDK